MKFVTIKLNVETPALHPPHLQGRHLHSMGPCPPSQRPAHGLRVCRGPGCRAVGEPGAVQSYLEIREGYSGEDSCAQEDTAGH